MKYLVAFAAVVMLGLGSLAYAHHPHNHHNHYRGPHPHYYGSNIHPGYNGYYPSRPGASHRVYHHGINYNLRPTGHSVRYAPKQPNGQYFWYYQRQRYPSWYTRPYYGGYGYGGYGYRGRCW